MGEGSGLTAEQDTAVVVCGLASVLYSRTQKTADEAGRALDKAVYAAHVLAAVPLETLAYAVDRSVDRLEDSIRRHKYRLGQEEGVVSDG